MALAKSPSPAEVSPHRLLTFLGPAPPCGEGARHMPTCCVRIRSYPLVLVAGPFSLWIEARVLATDFPERQPRGWCDKELACFPQPWHGCACPCPGPGRQKSGPKAAPRPSVRHRQLIPLSWLPQRICLVRLCLRVLSDSSC